MIDINFPQPLQFLAEEIQALNHAIHTEQFFKNLLHGHARELLPFVYTVLDEEYRNSPIFNASIDRETLAQIVDRVSRLATASGISAADALINLLVLTELLIWRSGHRGIAKILTALYT